MCVCVWSLSRCTDTYDNITADDDTAAAVAMLLCCVCVCALAFPYRLSLAFVELVALSVERKTADPYYFLHINVEALHDAHI